MGDSGEAAMNRLMESEGGFEHNNQSFRVVTELEERYPDFPGLNLSYEVLEGILKHTTEYDNPTPLKNFKNVGYPTLEAQVVNFADEIAYMNHDLDDGLQYGMLTPEMLKEVDLWRETYQEVSSRFPKTPEKVKRFRTVSRLIHRMMIDLQEETRKRILDNKIETLEDVRQKGKNIVALSDSMKKKTAEIKKYLYENMYYHWRVIRMGEKANRIITNLFEAYLKNPKILPEEFYRLIVEDKNTKRHICDYIAGMTDRFALQEHKKLFDPEERV